MILLAVCGSVIVLPFVSLNEISVDGVVLLTGVGVVSRGLGAAREQYRKKRYAESHYNDSFLSDVYTSRFDYKRL